MLLFLVVFKMTTPTDLIKVKEQIDRDIRIAKDRKINSIGVDRVELSNEVIEKTQVSQALQQGIDACENLRKEVLELIDKRIALENRFKRTTVSNAFYVLKLDIESQLKSGDNI